MLVLIKNECNLVLSVCAKFEECAAKTVGGVGFLMKAYFRFPSVANSSLTVARFEIST